MARLIGIATHQSSRGEICRHTSIKASLELGLDDYPGRKNLKTAITILSQEQWQLSTQLAGCASLDWTERRSQLLIDKGTFSKNDLGKRIQIGDLILQVTAETDPCQRMDDLCPGLRKALASDFRGGIRCCIIKPGEIKLGDEVRWLID
jgi:MOSC domain-containing protein YiiM